MIFEVTGGQQLVGVAPEGKSGGPHLVRSGGAMGAARDNGSLLRVVAAPQRPPRPMRTFLLSNIPRLMDSCISLFPIGWFSGSLALHDNLEA